MVDTYIFRGKTIEQLKSMSTEELIKITNADTRHVLKKGFSPEEKILLKKIEKRAKAKKSIKTHVREMIILPSFVGLTIGVHNGKEFVPVEIKPNMVFHRLGEYALTTKQVRPGAPGLRATRSSGFVPIK
jgi:small subunit ribosomal protein S19